MFTPQEKVYLLKYAAQRWGITYDAAMKATAEEMQKTAGIKDVLGPALAIGAGAGLAKIMSLPEEDRRALAAKVLALGGRMGGHAAGALSDLGGAVGASPSTRGALDMLKTEGDFIGDYADFKDPGLLGSLKAVPNLIGHIYNANRADTMMRTNEEPGILNQLLNAQDRAAEAFRYGR